MWKNGYDLDYEVDNIETFIDEFKNKKLKEVEDKNNNKKVTMSNIKIN